jgi:hemerythrin
MARWNSTLALGVPAIDKDHQRLLEAIERLHVADADHEGAADVQAALLRAIDEVIEYTRGHFRREEMLMRLAGYPDYAAHVGLHRKASRQVEQWEQRLRREPTCARVRAFCDALSDWLVAHVVEEDVKIKPWVEKLEGIRAA